MPAVVDVFERLKATDRLPSPPAVALRVLELARDDHTSAKDVAETISSDPALTARILRFANSPLMGVRQEVSSVSHAIVVIGLRRVQMMALSFSLLSLEQKANCPSFDYEQFWSQSLARGVAARTIAQHTRRAPPEEAFVVGLLCRIGQLAFAQALPAEYDRVLREASATGDLIVAERSMLGASHLEVGSRLLEMWNLPEQLFAGIAQFGRMTSIDANDETPPLACALCAADLAAAIMFGATECTAGEVDQMLSAVKHFFGIEAQEWNTLFGHMVQQWQQYGEVLTIPTGEVKPFDQIEAEARQQLAQLSERVREEERGERAPGDTARVSTSGGTSMLKADIPKQDSPRPAFVPRRPHSLQEAGLTADEAERFICKLLLARGATAGRKIATHFGLPFGLMHELLMALKNDMVVMHKNAAPFNDYEYVLTDLGRERARNYLEECSYFGAAPVPLADYIASVSAQTITRQQVLEADVRAAFADITVSPTTLRRVGPAINSGRGMFLYGSAGNGKSSIAERITRCFGTEIWIPRAIGVDGEIIRLFDPAKHVEVHATPATESGSLTDETDRRWVRIVRPTIVVGGELTMAELEIQQNPVTKISEAPLQLKSNCGTLVIDDFGRQRIATHELLNRWIVPLEKRYDFLNLANGKKIKVPFDQLLIFSTNLEPRDLVDEAFLRRIPYKLQVVDPTPDEFCTIFEHTREQLGFPPNPAALEYVIETHYQKAGRPMRCCHPRDLLLQVRNDCLYQDRPLELTPERLDFAVESYFTVM